MTDKTKKASAEDYQHFLKHGHFPNEPKPSKYGNEKVQWGGETFDSKWELERWLQLVAMETAGDIEHLVRQVVIILQPAFEANDEKVRAIKYVADFMYYLVDGDSSYEVVEDAKGFQTDVSKLKWKMAKWLYRDRPMIFRLSRKAGIREGLGALPEKDKTHG